MPSEKHELASFGQRLLALVIDGVILIVLSRIWIAMFGARLGFLMNFVSPLYTILLWVNWDGQTVGKKVMGIKVINTNNKPIQYSTAIIRYLGYILSSVFLFLGYLWMLWDQDKQTWHDKIANTQVVKV